MQAFHLTELWKRPRPATGKSNLLWRVAQLYYITVKPRLHGRRRAIIFLTLLDHTLSMSVYLTRFRIHRACLLIRGKKNYVYKIINDSGFYYWKLLLQTYCLFIWMLNIHIHKYKNKYLNSGKSYRAYTCTWNLLSVQVSFVTFMCNACFIYF